MKRRSRWLRWPRGRQQAAVRAPESLAAPHPMRYRVLLRFRDGSSEVLDPTSPVALELHTLADEWLTGRR